MTKIIHNASAITFQNAKEMLEAMFRRIASVAFVPQPDDRFFNSNNMHKPSGLFDARFEVNLEMKDVGFSIIGTVIDIGNQTPCLRVTYNSSR